MGRFMDMEDIFYDWFSPGNMILYPRLIAENRNAALIDINDCDDLKGIFEIYTITRRVKEYMESIHG